MTPRLLVPDDMPGLIRLKDAAGWNQTEQDWLNVMRLAPDGCFGLDHEGRLAASATAMCFGDKLAWIGMVLTDPELRGRGFARSLMEHSIGYLEGRRIEWIKLDATAMGRPLYLKLGFVDECPVERWRRPPEAPPFTGGKPLGSNGEEAAAAASATLWSLLLKLDREATGADRSALLDTLRQQFEFKAAEDGYAIGRPGSRAAYFGPCVTRSPEVARRLLQWFVGRHPGESLFWDILPTNEAAVVLAREAGFERVRELMQMARPGVPDPSPFNHRDENVFAIAGFEYG
jgi:GNAT superfamily N-acetyltransferase